MIALLETDVLVVGAGPAGLAAAVRAAEHGARVTLIDQAPAAGGQIWRRGPGMPESRDARRWTARLGATGVVHLASAEVVDGTMAEGFLVTSRARAMRVRARAVVLATGARELFLPFEGWTYPNVMGAAGLQALVKGGLDVRGQRVVLAGSGPLLLPVAATLARHGARLVLVAEQAPPEEVRAFTRSLWRWPARVGAAIAMRAAFATTRYRTGTWVRSAEGDDRVRSVTLTDGVRRWSERCDYLACGFGLLPSTELGRVLGCATSENALVVDDRQRTSVAGVYAAGECTGIGGAPLSLVEGEIAGLAAAGISTIPAPLVARRAAERAFAARVAQAFALRGELNALATPETILCRCEDVPLRAIVAWEGVRAARLHSRAGMGACQGRICGAALETLRGWPPSPARPPVFPAALGALAGVEPHAE